MSLIDELFINSSCYLRSSRLDRVHCTRSRATHAQYVSVPCDAHSNTHATADAQRGEALLGVALLHFVEKRHQHARAGGANGMADRDRAAIDVDLAGIPAEVLVDRAGLRRKSLVGLDQVEVADAPAGLLERRA